MEYIDKSLGMYIPEHDIERPKAKKVVHYPLVLSDEDSSEIIDEEDVSLGDFNNDFSSEFNVK